MSWLKRKLRRWLNSGDEISIAEDRAYVAQAHSNFGETQTSVQMFKAMNGIVLVLHSQTVSPNKAMIPRQAGPTMYVLKEGESVQDAVATLLVKARLDSM